MHFSCCSIGIDRWQADSSLKRRSSMISSWISSLDGVEIDVKDEEIDVDRENDSLDCEFLRESSKIDCALLWKTAGKSFCLI